MEKISPNCPIYFPIICNISHDGLSQKLPSIFCEKMQIAVFFETFFSRPKVSRVSCIRSAPGQVNYLQRPGHFFDRISKSVCLTAQGNLILSQTKSTDVLYLVDIETAWKWMEHMKQLTVENLGWLLTYSSSV